MFDDHVIRVKNSQKEVYLFVKKGKLVVAILFHFRSSKIVSSLICLQPLKIENLIIEISKMTWKKLREESQTKYVKKSGKSPQFS